MLSQDDIIYFIMTDRFFDGDPSNNADVDLRNPQAYHGGDFKGIMKKIPYLRHLGITALWITPVCVNIHQPERGRWGYHGYWPLDFEHVDPHLYSPRRDMPAGSRWYLKELADRLHRNGIKLVLDMVVNHAGYGHPGLHDDPGTPVRRGWFNAAGSTGDTDGWMWGLPDLDHDNLDVSDYFVNVILDWIEETGVDCIRMDTARHVETAFWYQFKNLVKSKHPDVSLLGEVFDTDIDRLSRYQQHFAFDSLFDFPLRYAIADTFIRDGSMNMLAGNGLPGSPQGVLDRDTCYTNHNRLVTLLDNHDMPRRFMTEALEHCGDRRAAAKVLKLALTFLMTARGIPQIYYGTEVALEGAGDPGTRQDMPWGLFDGRAPRRGLDVESDVFEHLRRLIAIRRGNEALTFGSSTTLYADHFIYAVLREFRGNAVIAVFNNGQAPMPDLLPLRIGEHGSVPSRIKRLLEGVPLENLLDGRIWEQGVTKGVLDVRLDGKSAVILSPTGRVP